MAQFAHSRDADKVCGLCHLPKPQCHDRHGRPSRQDDPRGIVSPAGIRQFDTITLLQMSQGHAGEPAELVALAKAELKRRQQIQSAVERCPLWALSPYEQQLHRGKGTTLKQEGSFCALA